MPSKQSPVKPGSVTAVDPQPSGIESSPVVAPATKRFKVAVLLFGGWLLFLVYLAYLTWSGK